ncbi:MAG: hypothetical protein K6T68_01305, partial [Alicyclobacillus shizuokensis]|nr:hypothetical protein [Alicyclobacillus shizuokensis]
MVGYIVQGIIFLLLFAGAVYLFVKAVSDRVRYVLAGAPDGSRVGDTGQRIRSFVVNVLLQKKVLAQPSGLAHFFIFWGFLVLVFGDLDFIVFHLTRWHFPWGNSNVYLFIQELLSLCVLAAVIVGLIRRYGLRPMRLGGGLEGGLILGLIGLIVLTYLVATGADVDLEGKAPGWWSPVVSAIAGWFSGVGRGALLTIAEVCFWIHVFCIFTFLYVIPRSKHSHMLGAMLN